MFDAAVERGRVEKVLAGLLEAENSKDADKAAQFYHQDVWVVPPGMDLVKGNTQVRDTLKAGYEAMPSLRNSHEYVEFQFAEAGDMCVVIGRYHLSAENNEALAFPADGKFVLVLRKIDGQWKIITNCFNA